MFRQVLQPVVRRARIGVRSAHDMPSEVKPGHMDEVPVPNKPWKEVRDKHQRGQNILLAAGVVVFGATVAFGKATNILFFNYSPPSLEGED